MPKSASLPWFWQSVKLLVLCCEPCKKERYDITAARIVAGERGHIFRFRFRTERPS
jgi:RNA:NAD 2'-phosphotransferase (TPT1/KptA family)